MKTLFLDTVLNEEKRIQKVQELGLKTKINNFKIDYDHFKILQPLPHEHQFIIAYKTWEYANRHGMNYFVREYFWNVYVLVRDGHIKLMENAFNAIVTA